MPEIILQAGNIFIFLQKTSRQYVRMLTWTEICTRKHCSYGEIIRGMEKKKYFAT